METRLFITLNCPMSATTGTCGLVCGHEENDREKGPLRLPLERCRWTRAVNFQLEAFHLVIRDSPCRNAAPGLAGADARAGQQHRMRQHGGVGADDDVA